MNQPVFILGDFNTLSLTETFPHLQQYINCPTRFSRTLDLCYGNIADAYKAVCRAPIGKSDHNVIHLLPTYRQCVRRDKPVEKRIQVWNKEKEDMLKDCFCITNWDVFFDSCRDPNELTDCITSYIQFCEETVVDTKVVKVFSNNKPWLSKDLKKLLNEKNRAFRENDNESFKMKRKELRAMVQKAKIDFKNKVEDQLANQDARSAWQGLNKMMGRDSRNVNNDITIGTDGFKWVNDLNLFYGRYDVADNGNKIKEISDRIPEGPPISLTGDQIRRSLKCIKPYKAPGPDGLRGRVLKICANELTDPLTKLFQFLSKLQIVPNAWKLSFIRPLLKKVRAKNLEDFRPVALTSY